MFILMRSLKYIKKGLQGENRKGYREQDMKNVCEGNYGITPEERRGPRRGFSLCTH